MRHRLSIILMALAVLAFAVACGRASQEEIDAALGIVPTPTLSAEGEATATANALAAASAEAGGSPAAGPAVAVGDVMKGRQQFQFQCQQCHLPNGSGKGPALAGSTSPVVNMSAAQLSDLIRNGTGHPGVQGIPEARINDGQLADLIAFLKDQAK